MWGGLACLRVVRRRFWLVTLVGRAQKGRVNTESNSDKGNGNGDDAQSLDVTADEIGRNEGVGGAGDGETGAPQAHVKRVVLASFVGTTIEWYDYFLYGTAAALVFPQIFFPNSSALDGTLMAFATYAVGFFARPFGGIVFGHFGDRIGRKAMLVTTLTMMGLATFLMGLLPGHAQIGVWAPILLVTLRVVQGFGVGGEWGGAVLMAVEHGKPGRRGFYASWVQAGVPVGMLLAAGVFAIFSSMNEKAFLAWGWRVPFLLGGLLLAVGTFIRLKVMESPVFERLQAERATQSPTEKATKKESLPIVEVLRTQWREVLLAMGARFAENACYYLFTVVSISFAVDWLDLEKSMILKGIMIACVVQLMVIPLFGMLSDRVGRRPVYLAGAFLVLIFAWPFFLMLESRETWLIWLALIIGLVAHSLMYAPQAAFFSELFGTGVRYTGASLGYQVASPLAGGLAPFICIWLLGKYDGASLPMAIYLAIMCVITLISVGLARETHRGDL